MAWAGRSLRTATNRRSSRPFYFRGCGLTAECLPAREVLAHGRHPGAIPGSRTNLLTGCASARGRVPKTPLTPGSTEAACHFSFGVVADKQCACPASRLKPERYRSSSTNFQALFAGVRRSQSPDSTAAKTCCGTSIPSSRTNKIVSRRMACHRQSPALMSSVLAPF